MKIFRVRCIHLLYLIYRNTFNIGGVSKIPYRNMFTQHMLSNSNTSWLFQKCWVPITQSIVVPCAVIPIFGHTEQCKQEEAPGTFCIPRPEQPHHPLPSLGQCLSRNHPAPFAHLLFGQNTSRNSQQWLEQHPKLHSCTPLLPTALLTAWIWEFSNVR